MHGIPEQPIHPLAARAQLLLLSMLLTIPGTTGICMASDRTYAIATVAWAGWSPLHVAEAKGFWEDLGIHVSVENYDDPTVLREALRAGRSDLGMDMVGSLVGEYMQGEPVVALMETNWSHGGDQIIIQKDRTLEDVLGEPVGVFLNQPSCLYFLGLYLQTNGRELSEYFVVEINAQDLAAQFLAGRILMIVDYQPWADQALTTGRGRILATSADFSGCIPECLWGFRPHVVRIPDEDLALIMRGWIRAAEWMASPGNRDEVRHILSTRTFVQNSDLTVEDLDGMLSKVVIHDKRGLWNRNRDQGGLFQYLLSLKDFLKSQDRLTREFQPQDIFDNRIILQTLKAEGLP